LQNVKLTVVVNVRKHFRALPHGELGVRLRHVLDRTPLRHLCWHALLQMQRVIGSRAG